MKPEPHFKVLNEASKGFCVFTFFSEALVFYNDGLARKEPYVFIMLDPNNYVVEYKKSIK